MAGDWIKIEHALPTKPEVMQLAALLECEEATVVGYLVVFWTWCDRNLSQKCPVARGTKIGLDRVVGRAGFCDAMQHVGWLLMDGDEVSIPNYDLHLSQSAKTRGVETRRKQQARTKTGTETGQTQDRNRTDGGTEPGPEKRREEKIDTASAVSVSVAVATPRQKRGPFVPPTVEQVAAYVTEINAGIDPNRFVDHYTARDWVLNNGRKVVDWKACVRTWIGKNYGTPQGSIRPAAGHRQAGGLFSREQQREAANKAALVEFLQSEGVCESNLGFDQPEANVGLHGRPDQGVVLRLKAVPGAGDQSIGGRASNVGDAIPGACRPIQEVPRKDAQGLLPDG